MVEQRPPTEHGMSTLAALQGATQKPLVVPSERHSYTPPVQVSAELQETTPAAAGHVHAVPMTDALQSGSHAQPD